MEYLNQLGGYLHDDDFSDFCQDVGKTEDEVIHDMVNSGWELGRDENYKLEYWGPRNQLKPLTQTKPEATKTFAAVN